MTSFLSFLFILGIYNTNIIIYLLTYFFLPFHEFFKLAYKSSFFFLFVPEKAEKWSISKELLFLCLVLLAERKVTRKGRIGLKVLEIRGII